MADAIRESPKRVLTIGDIGDALDVTSETVRRKREQLESHPDVETEKVGRATAYYIVDEIEDPDEVDFDTEDLAPDLEEGAEEQPSAPGVVMLDVVLERAVGMSVIGTAAFLLTASGAWRFTDPVTLGLALLAWQLGTLALFLIDRRKEWITEQIGLEKTNGETA
jgi:hypothetical protein